MNPETVTFTSKTQAESELGLEAKGTSLSVPTD
jgi:hypothetical protein